MPSMSEGQEAQEHIDQKSRPDLPADSVGSVAQEIGQLQGLLDLLEEGFNGPAATVKVSELASVRFICFFHPCRVAGQTGFSKPFS